MTEPTPAAQSPAPTPASPHKGKDPRWKIVYDAMSSLPPDTLITYNELGEILGVDASTRSGKVQIGAAARKAIRELEVRANMVFTVVRGQGYQRAEPTTVIIMARRHQEKAIAEIEHGASKVATIDLTKVDTQTANLARATGIAFARQAAAMKTLDVRQRRLDTALAALGSEVYHQRDRLKELEDRVNKLTGDTPAQVAPEPPSPAETTAQTDAVTPPWQSAMFEADQLEETPPAQPARIENRAQQPPTGHRPAGPRPRYAVNPSAQQ